jgi:hypothetical protein
MINIEGLQKTTRLTVCKYEHYQNKQLATNTPLTGQEHARNTPVTTTKEGEELKNVKKEEPSKSADFIDQLLSRFVKEHGNYEILNRGKERIAISKILSKYKEKYPAANSEEVLEGLTGYFRQCLNINDDWLKTNMSPSIMVAKFNEINTILRNGKVKSASKAIDGSTIEDVIRSQARKLGIVSE